MINAPEQQATGNANVEDSNGNEITVAYSSSNNTTTVTDTLNQTLAITPPNGSTPGTYQYTGGSGSQATLTVKYSTFAVQTNFGCSGITEFGATTENLVSEIDLPDDNPNGTRDRYVFTYETTPGDTNNPHHVTARIRQITLPTGGVISYAYSGGGTGVNGITIADGSDATLGRTTPDLWMMNATGQPVSVEPFLKAAEAALAVEEASASASR